MLRRPSGKSMSRLRLAEKNSAEQRKKQVDEQVID
jgi:hypothetical protein